MEQQPQANNGPTPPVGAALQLNGDPEGDQDDRQSYLPPCDGNETSRSNEVMIIRPLRV